MNALFGIDLGGNYKSAADLFKRLDFPRPEVDLIHTVELPIFEDSYPGYIPETSCADLAGLRQSAGQQALDNACDIFNFCKHRCFMNQGNPAAELMDYADNAKVDLVACGGSHHGILSSFLFNSVSRALTVAAHQSVLIGRAHPFGNGKLKVVFATDHSRYSDLALQLFLSWKPQGVAKIAVVHAFRYHDTHEMFTADPVSSNQSYEEAAFEAVRLRNSTIADEVQKAGFACESLVLDESANSGIKRAMAECNADLLVLGAQGHGFLERLTIGSVSLHQVVAEDYSVLIMRPKP